MKVSCVIVTYNGMRYIDRCLESLQKLEGSPAAIVVDNNSADGTPDHVASAFPEAELIRSDRNLGFGKANNLGMNIAIGSGSDFIFLLNQDAYVQRGSWENILSMMQSDPSLGIVSPIHYSPDGKTFDYKFRRYADEIHTPGLLGDIAAGKPKACYDTDFINAAAWIVSVRMLKETGLFHPVFQMYMEDMEFVHRIRSKGFRIAITPEFSVIHDRPQEDPARGLTIRIVSFENEIYMKRLVRKKQKTRIAVFIMLSIFKDLVLLDWSMAYRKIRRSPAILQNLKA